MTLTPEEVQAVKNAELINITKLDGIRTLDWIHEGKECPGFAVAVVRHEQNDPVGRMRALIDVARALSYERYHDYNLACIFCPIEVVEQIAAL